MNDQTKQPPVPDLAVTGLDGAPPSLAAAHAELKDVRALTISTCVVANYNPSTNKICFSVPIYGDICITSPIPIPAGADLKAYVETCGTFMPTGLKATIRLNGGPIFSGTVVGNCQ